ncbi:hypothetical protein ABE29_22815 [Cytobacillus firmus]|nr:hypothetical protein [Cytobacillus firmus]MBG9551202.1 hypothetical protein [Cytobacillus firmus]MBG9557984.1 hypothetical protein [Cytobacillus firmus]MBG9577607.1 hypothetical protein [Cytobacillus firmus]
MILIEGLIGQTLARCLSAVNVNITNRTGKPANRILEPANKILEPANRAGNFANKPFRTMNL